MNIQRYNCITDGYNCPIAEEDINGEWVKWEDVEPLLKELERLRLINNGWNMSAKSIENILKKK